MWFEMISYNLSRTKIILLIEYHLQVSCRIRNNSSSMPYLLRLLWWAYCPVFDREDGYDGLSSASLWLVVLSSIIASDIKFRETLLL